ncbi:recombination regulator RecX [Aestuariibacter sp. AA17]|uniref:Regulatory protein RecX n=1 Tax=Fluctibacter corallii TaxID=2984329 RepID=A0ABT3A3I3_9ALTE|nr:regulatory protein RecX [Aestuariibacter sp. AA17]MCV2883172.1 recombination regulator RecX [Aestuariibacter sp. AA17]
MSESPSENDRKIITHAITHLLSRREHSQKELLQKLLAKGHSQALCEEQIEKFVERNIQSNLRFAESLIRSKVSKGQGELRALNALREHGVSDNDIQTAMYEVAPDWFALASQVRQKKYGANIPDDWSTKQKQSRFLQYRGFTLEQIRFAFQRES